MDIEKTLSALTVEEKLRLCMGLDFWNTYPVERLGIPSVRTSDGPHGLRKQEVTNGDVALNDSVPATCFPPASLASASFDRGLYRRMGAAIAEEAIMQDIDVVLGPAVNIKRSPLCGRNFEYVSEDPCVAGEYAAAYISGMQEKGVGSSLKHFAVNNQETLRLTINSVLDERTLREIYLPAFATAVRKSQPWTVMASYNRINGVYGCENSHTIQELLRGEWGFKGLVESDWSAVNDRTATLAAGCDLEMPGTGEARLEELRAALREGRLKESTVDRAVRHVLELVERKLEAEPQKARIKAEVAQKGGIEALYAEHDRLALEIAEKSMVLLKNEGPVLPLAAGTRLAVLGAFAEQPRYQGGGSSHISPAKLSSFNSALCAAGISFEYRPGYRLNSEKPDPALLREATDCAAGADAAVVLAGLTDFDEFEGCDRKNLSLPESHNALIRAAAAANKNIIVVICAGSAVELPWLDQCRGLIYAGVTGQAGGEALRAILFGGVNPSGHLTESFPLHFADLASRNSFPGGNDSVHYTEGLYVGYRYYARAGVPVNFPFGFGLSYTDFAVSAPRFAGAAAGNGSRAAGRIQGAGSPEAPLGEGQTLHVEVDVENKGKRAGACAVQLYMRAPSENDYAPDRALRDFARVELDAGAKQTLSFELSYSAFERFDIRDGWVADTGSYMLFAAQNSAELGEGLAVAVSGRGRPVDRTGIEAYFRLAPGIFSGAGAEAAFDRLYRFGASLPGVGQVYAKGPAPLSVKQGRIAMNTPFCRCRHTLIGAIIGAAAEHVIRKANQGRGAAATRRAMLAQLGDTPIRSMVTMNAGTNLNTGRALVRMMNGQFFPGLREALASLREEKKK